MLKQLYIRSFTLIDELNVDFQAGFSAITGETGAGKSIILGAVALLLGQRAESKLVKNGADRCVIEAHFDLSQYQLETFFQENDIDYDPADCIMRRELTAAGKSRSFINDTPVPLTLMKQLGEQLVDIHSQHKNLLLQEEDFQLNTVDVIARDARQLSDYKSTYRQLQEVEKRINQLRQEMEQTRADEDYLRFQADELQEAMLEAGMQEELEKESEMLSHVEDIKGGLFEADSILSGNQEAGVVERLKDVARTLNATERLYPDIKDVARRVETSLIEIDDVAREVRNLLGRMEYDPMRLETVNQQLDTIYSLQKKHHVATVEELISIHESIDQRLSAIEHSDDELAALDDERERLEGTCFEKAQDLTKRRTKAAREIERELTARLIPLGIPHVRFHIDISPKALSESGQDKICFMFSANTSTQLQPVSEVASGGEIARVMLAIKAMVSGAVRRPTIVFDEIDTGVSGKIAEQMARLMDEMGKNNRQVISITHLPQIAALAENHFKVFKEETPGGTRSQMVRLTDEERVMEIAQMLSGSDVSEAAIGNARNLLGR